MHKKPSHTEILYRSFNDKMRFGNVQELETALSKIKGCQEDSDFKKICNKVMWRLISSVKKAHKSGWVDKESKMLGVLRRASRWLKIDNKNKRMAWSVLHKENIPMGEEFEAFFRKINPNEHLEPEEVSDRDVYRNLMQYFKTSNDIGGRVFQTNVKKMMELYGERKFEPFTIHFSPLYGMMQRAAPKQALTFSVNLFDDRVPKPDTINKNMVVLVSQAYVSYIKDNMHSDKLNRFFQHEFRSFISAVVRKNSYTRKEVQSLMQVFHNDYASWPVREHFKDMQKHLFHIYRQKQDIEINKLNTWMGNHPKKRPLSRLARSLVYADMLQQKLVDDVDIGKENFNNLYLEKKNKLVQEMEALYNENGEKLSQNEIFSQVEKRYKEKAAEKMEPVNILLNTRYRASHFCGTTKHYLQECGLRQTWGYSRFVGRGRDGLF